METTVDMYDAVGLMVSSGIVVHRTDDIDNGGDDTCADGYDDDGGDGGDDDGGDDNGGDDGVDNEVIGAQSRSFPSLRCRPCR